MTDQNESTVTGPGAPGSFEPDDDRTARLRREIEAGNEGELSEEDYQYALEQGLIEG